MPKSPGCPCYNACNWPVAQSGFNALVEECLLRTTSRRWSVLAMEIFEGVRDARALTALWRDEYNTQRPHSSLGYQTPAGFAAACAAFASAKASAQAAHAACGEVPCS